MQTTVTRTTARGWWTPGQAAPEAGDEALRQALLRVDRPVCLVETDQGPAVATGGSVVMGTEAGPKGSLKLLAYAPSLRPEELGDQAFCQAHGVKLAYVSGAMANGIASEEIVEALAAHDILAFFGAAGLPLPRVEAAIDRLQKSVGGRPFGFNLIHSPNEPALESGVVDLYLRRGINRVSASAYLGLTLPLVRYRVSGIHRAADGAVVTPNRVVAKVSRVEVAEKFFAPPPEKMLRALVEDGSITAEQAELAATVPMAEDLTAEADSGGHTDNRPALTLVPTMIALRDEMQERHNYPMRLRVGAAGGIATPESVAAAFMMGAAYVLTGSVNQSCVEAGTSQLVREMLVKASQADVTMAPAADMFEMGVQVQVLKWGTMFPVRARKLYELYRSYPDMESLPAKEREVLERDFFRCRLEEEWSNTRKFFEERDPAQITRAEQDPKHKMALVFRSYLGRSSNWANAGLADRKVDYQIWCGPAMGAFNQWVKGSFLEGLEHRKVYTVGRNLMLGAAVLSRVNWLVGQGVPVPVSARKFRSMTDQEIDDLLNSQGDA